MTMHLVDPELRALLELFPTIALTADILPAVRAAEIPFPPDPRAVAAVDLAERKVPGPAGSPDVGVAIYTPKDRDGPLPCIFPHPRGRLRGRLRGRAQCRASLAGP